MEDDSDSSGGNVSSEKRTEKQQQQIVQNVNIDVYSRVLKRLKESSVDEDVNRPGFDDELLAHFVRLPSRYALDINAERAEDVLMHKRLLQLAQDPKNRPAVVVRLVQVQSSHDDNTADSRSSDIVVSDSEDASSSKSLHPPPAFGSSPNIESLPLDVDESNGPDDESSVHANTKYSRPMHEINFSTGDKPKLLSQLTSILSDMELNIQEAHAFSTVDGYSLDVFVVDGWPYEETEQLKSALEKELLTLERQPWPQSYSPEHAHKHAHITIPNDGTDVWEIDLKLLKFGKKIASGSTGDLYKGTYCSQEVAIKILKPEVSDSKDTQKEFGQEVYIMRKVRHKNIVQFIGACTKPLKLCILTEFMSKGSVYEFLHKRNGSFKLPALIRVAIDIAKGMNYLHQNNILHRDLKTANLLMDDNDVVKVADFGVARVKSHTGVMTAETGTYRWMAPEVIEHKPYDQKADVFSYGIVLWELLTAKLPHMFLTPLQAAVGVVQAGLRPTIPTSTHPKLKDLIEKCWQTDPTLRPEFSEILDILEPLAKEVGSDDRRKDKSAACFFSSVLKRK